VHIDPNQLCPLRSLSSDRKGNVMSVMIRIDAHKGFSFPPFGGTPPDRFPAGQRPLLRLVILSDFLIASQMAPNGGP
jgi:hypothetical protein